MARSIGLPPRRLSPRRWRGLAQQTLPYGAQDIFGVLLFKVDAVILSLLATEAAVGRYGAAYRLLEATLFVSWALNGAFAAMYARLGRETVPSIRSVFQRSLKLALVLLVPAAVAMAVLAKPLMELLFGAEFGDAAGALRLLAPIVVLLCIVTLSSSLIISRVGPAAIVRISAAMVALNVALNLALIPPFEASGAAAAMLVTELAFGALAMRLAIREAGGVELRSMTAAPLLAGAAMLAVMLALASVPAASLAAGAVVYVAVFLLLERSISPGDLDFARTLLRTRLRSRAPA
jgi:O-antigen/teichoic acid export membrane protein